MLPSGEIIWTGANVLKNVSGYNLTQLMTGSEGTLGVITKIVLRLIPMPKKTMIMLVPFYSAEEACDAVSAIFRAGITPSMLEFMERDALEWGIKYIEDINFILKDNVQAQLLIEIDGNNEKQSGFGNLINEGVRSIIEYPEGSGNIVVGTFKLNSTRLFVPQEGFELWMRVKN